MATNETEERDEETQKMEKQIGLIQKGVKYGLGIAIAGAFLCVIVMLPLVMFSIPIGELPGEPRFLALIVVSMVVPFVGIVMLGAALYKLLPLAIRYRRTNRPDEEMFP